MLNYSDIPTLDGIKDTVGVYFYTSAVSGWMMTFFILITLSGYAFPCLFSFWMFRLCNITGLAFGISNLVLMYLFVPKADAIQYLALYIVLATLLLLAVIYIFYFVFVFTRRLYSFGSFKIAMGPSTFLMIGTSIVPTCKLPAYMMVAKFGTKIFVPFLDNIDFDGPLDGLTVFGVTGISSVKKYTPVGDVCKIKPGHQYLFFTGAAADTFDFGELGITDSFHMA